ncbi:alpha/beta fold hydrolase [Nocardia tengchongensis]|uniref:alpha/beta fold hydrolase n=2 Tax=Nocardia tengchongensis TaxID=2055889 RepID=UPI0036786A61
MQLRTGVTVGISRTGSGPAVLLLGGLGMPSIVWELSGLTSQLVAAGFEVIAHTARGIPPASAPPAPYSVDDLAGDAAALLDELDLTSDVTVVGYSLGAFTAQALLQERPDNFRAAVFIAGLNPSPLVEIVDNMELELIEATGSLPTSVSTFELLMTTLPTAALQDHAAVPGWHTIFADDANRWTGAEGLKGQLTASRDWTRDKQSHLDRLSRIGIPVLSIAFEHDLFFPPAGEREAAGRIPDCEYILIPQAAHGGLSTHGAEPVQRIVEFCSEVKKRHAAG